MARSTRSNKPSILTHDAMAEIREMVIAAGIRGMRPLNELSAFADYLSIEVERAGRAVTATMYVKAERAGHEAAQWPDAPEGAKVFWNKIAVELSWSGTSRSIATTTACIALYRELADLGAEIEARFERERVGEVYEPKADAKS